jgi:beta-phosphoglucomutase
MKCVAVRFVGHHPAEALRNAGADRIVESLKEVSALDIQRL